MFVRSKEAQGVESLQLGLEPHKGRGSLKSKSLY